MPKSSDPIKVIIIGNGMAAEILYGYLRQDCRYELVGFSVDAEFIEKPRFFDLPVVALDELNQRFDVSEHQLLMAIGYQKLNQTRAEIFQRVQSMGYQVLSYIHPDAKVYSDEIGAGSLIMANTVVEVFARIGQNSVIWANCVVGHHSQVADHCWIASGTVLAGQAQVGDYCFLGVNATVANQVKVASNNIIGANTALLKHSQENQVYLSSQGEKIRFNAQEYAEYFLK